MWDCLLLRQPRYYCPASLPKARSSRNRLTVFPDRAAAAFTASSSSGWQLTEKLTRFTPVGFLPPPWYPYPEYLFCDSAMEVHHQVKDNLCDSGHCQQDETHASQGVQLDFHLTTSVKYGSLKVWKVSALHTRLLPAKDEGNNLKDYLQHCGNPSQEDA